MPYVFDDPIDVDSDADTISWASVLRASGFDTFTATPTSANLRALVTDETGSGQLVFATSPTLSSPTLSGTVAGTPTFSGNLTFTGTTSITISTTEPRLDFYETNAGADAKRWSIINDGGSFGLQTRTDADVFGQTVISIARSGTTAGTIALSGTALTFGGVAIPTISSTDTLTNKTLSSPTLSGTVAGSPTLSGSLTFAGGHQRITQSSTGASPAASGSSLTDIILRVGASNVGTAGYGLDFGTSNATGQVWMQARDWNNYATNVAINLNPNGGGATLGGVAIPTISSTDTLSNKTLSSPTLSGTVAGAVTFSGSQIDFSGDLRVNGGQVYFGGTTTYLNYSATNQIDIVTDNTTRIRVDATGLVTINNAMVVGTPTGGNKGTGTINAQAVYDDNTLLTCYIIEAWKHGSIDLAKWDALTPNRERQAVYETVATGETDDSGQPITEQVLVTEAWTEERQHTPARGFAQVAAARLDIDNFSQFVFDNERLPAFPAPDRWQDLYNGKMASGDLIQRLWETVEVMAVHSIEARKRELALIARVEALEAAQ